MPAPTATTDAQIAAEAETDTVQALAVTDPVVIVAVSQVHTP